MTTKRILGIVLAVVLALLGGIALTGYVSGADARALAGTKTVDVYVAKTTIPVRTSGDSVAPYLEVKHIPAVAAVAGRVTSLSQLHGLKANSAIEAGEQLITARWSSAAKVAAGTPMGMGKDMEAVTISVPAQQAVGGRLKAGDIVGVILLATPKGSSNGPTAWQKLHNVKVLQVDGAVAPGSAAASGSSNAGNVSVTLALEVDPATQVIWTQANGTVWLTLEQSTTDHTSNSQVDGSAVLGGSTFDASN
ncbi:RcpC/CpaB family pilus assembly protein [Amnibacterium sp. CER49]|uniref:Flp pilus assembly protein CpaB n=1 Tax=Amnibacterium sp. CER49 TaxID=3039161 RepID=UPI00244CFCA5|nr:RcpC/CpaB family pilus assembly protein [Amnibacterium sp. CER49]MDH2444372.1 RcpC/CpaB family pilus assembly protein [Amnibacterium sp. CER49]